MKKHLGTVCIAALLMSMCGVRGGELENLAGKWTVKKTNDEGQSYTQTIELKKDKFVFEIIGSDGNVRIHGEGDARAEKLGPLNTLRFTKIRGGRSADDMQDVDDEYTLVYMLDGDTWTVAMNFDKERERQKPGVDVYKKVKAEAKATK